MNKKIYKLQRTGTDNNGGKLIWNESVLNALGTMPDETLAILAGCKFYSIYRKRMELGIARYKSQWPEEHIKLLGTDTDTKVGLMIGRSQPAVCQKRRSLGIPKYKAKKVEVKPLSQKDVLDILTHLEELENSIKDIKDFLTDRIIK